MPLPERITDDWCGLAQRWVLDPVLAEDLVLLDQWAAQELAAEGIRWGGLFIISGRRSPSVQIIVNPDAPRSFHTFCPSLAADLRVGNRAATLTEASTWAFLGQRWEFIGHRWGGRFRPPDLNHFDMGKPFEGERPGFAGFTDA